MYAREQRLAAALRELDQLIGLTTVKERVRSYANFLKLQQTRREAGLTTMPISLPSTSRKGLAVTIKSLTSPLSFFETS